MPSKVPSSVENTLMGMMSAAGATPFRLPLEPAAMPATWVPWSQNWQGLPEPRAWWV
jgi:hypothetical protein